MKGNAKYSVTRFFADEMIDGFRRLGYRSTVFDARYHTAGDLMRMAEQPYRMVFAVNGVFSEQDISREIVDRLEKNGAVFVAQMVDHPCHHRKRLALFRKGAHIYFPDRKHIAYAEQFYPGKCRYGFLPHAGCQGGMALGKDSGERRLELVFAGSYYDPGRYADTISKMEPDTAAFMRQCIQLLREKPYLTVEEGMCVVLYGEEAVCGRPAGHLPVDFQEKSNSDILLFLEEYIRTDIRSRVVRAIAEGGQRIHVYGAGWETFTCEKMENFVWEGEVDFGTLSKVLEEARIFLNVMPWFKDGSHERVFTAMLHGAVVLSDESRYLEENFLEGEAAYYYSLEHLELLAAQVRRILKDPGQMDRVRKAAFEQAVAGHLWEHRAKEILGSANYCK